MFNVKGLFTIEKYNKLCSHILHNSTELIMHIRVFFLFIVSFFVSMDTNSLAKLDDNTLEDQKNCRISGTDHAIITYICAIAIP